MVYFYTDCGSASSIVAIGADVPLHARYPSEAAFRDEFVRPLLNRMGYFLVTEMHGTREFGADFIFSEMNRFGHLRHYAAQVKHEKSINSGAIIDTLASQIAQAFAHDFTLPDSPRPVHISSVYVFNSGRITDNAKDDLHGRLRRSAYGDNVYVLDGARLDSLDRWSHRETDREMRARLVGLIAQLELNVRIWTGVRDHSAQASSKIEMRRSILDGLANFLTNPFYGDDALLKDIVLVWQQARQIDGLYDQIVLPFNLDDWQKMCREAIVPLCEAAIRNANALSVNFRLALETIKPL